MVRGRRQGDDMNRVAIAYSTKDRVEKTRQTIEPLLQPEKFDLWWIDGSETEEGRSLPGEYKTAAAYGNVGGGSCRAIVFALTKMLEYTEYDFVGLCENDVQLNQDWFDETMALFAQGHDDGLAVGAVSARCYEDRILVQRDGYALMHNLGAGMIIFSRKAAEIVLQRYRTQWTTENRRVFAMLSGFDIGAWWAFRGSEHMLVADWGYDCNLARHGLCSLALTPAKATQLDDLAAQGLKMASKEVKERRDDAAFKAFVDHTLAMRDGDVTLPGVSDGGHLRNSNGMWTIFAHQIGSLGGKFIGDWRYGWSIAYGPFAWEAGDATVEISPRLYVHVSGPCALLVSGGDLGGKINVEVRDTGWTTKIELPPDSVGSGSTEFVQIVVPGRIAYRRVAMLATKGVRFYGLQCYEQQPHFPTYKFDFYKLPPMQRREQ